MLYKSYSLGQNDKEKDNTENRRCTADSKKEVKMGSGVKGESITIFSKITGIEKIINKLNHKTPIV